GRKRFERAVKVFRDLSLLEGDYIILELPVIGEIASTKALLEKGSNVKLIITDFEVLEKAKQFSE
ncbi:methyltransferase type 12, partial [Sulfolobus sp. A20-N-F6]